MNIVRKVVPFESVKAEAEGGAFGKGFFEGYAACTKNLDSYGEIIAPGAFAADLDAFLADGFIGGLNHDWDQPIGKPASAKEDGRGLFGKADLIGTQHAQDCRVYMGSGICKKLSIGFSTLGRMFIEKAEDVEAWWAQNGHMPSDDERAGAKYGATILTRVKLYEFSPVMRPANTLCDITASKSVGVGPRARLTLDDQFLAALGTVEDFAGRFRSYAERKAESGRPIPPKRIAQFRRVFEGMEAVLAGLPSVDPEADPAAMRRMQAEAMALEAGLLDLL